MSYNATHSFGFGFDIGDRVRRIDLQKMDCPECGERFIPGKWQSGDLNCAKKKPVDPSPERNDGQDLGERGGSESALP